MALTSKEEEDKIILHEVFVLKDKMAGKAVTPKKMKEYLIRMIYVEMLGHDATFGHIHGIKLVSEKKLLEKRVGYLAVSLTLHPDHSFMLLLVNSLQRDLRSDNFLEVAMALTVVCKMVNSETIPALIALVISALDHAQANIRKKAVMALHRFHQISPECIEPIIDKVRKILCDKDPSVMGASLCLFHELAISNQSNLKDLVPSFVVILKQVTEHRLPRDYDYHRMPAPWIQLKLLQILAVLGNADKAASEGMYEILHEVMKRADIGINVGYAIVYECVRTVTSIYPEKNLLEDAALSISRFITSENHNLKYLGVNSLASIVQIDPKYAAEHQLLVIDCLEDPDETLRRKTLDLLYRMTNTQNVLVIVEKLIAYLGSTTDVYLRTDLVSRINQLSEKFSPNLWWYIETCTTLFELGGDLVKPEVAHNLMRLIAEAEEVVEDEQGNEIDIRAYTTDVYLEYLDKPQIPDVLVQVIVWTLGEFGQLSSSHTLGEVVEKLNTLMDLHFDDTATRSWILSALTKLVAHLPQSAPLVKGTAQRFTNSIHVDLQQRAHEFLELSRNPNTMGLVLPMNAHAEEEIDVDEGLSFLASYVNAALEAGATAYQENREDADDGEMEQYVNKQVSHTSGLKFDAYAKPETHLSTMATSWETPTMNQQTATSTANNAPDSFNLAGKKKVWGPAGFNENVDSSMSSSSTPAYGQPTARSEPQYQQSTVPEHQKKYQKAVEPAVKELTEREKSAQALFGGGAAAKPKMRVAARPGATARRPAEQAPVAPAQAAVVRPQVDLFGGAMDEAPVPKAAPADSFGFNNSKPAQPAAAPKGDLLDLFGDVFGGEASVGAPAQQQQQQQKAQPADNSDPFSSMLGGMSLETQPAPTQAASKIGSAGMSNAMRQRLSNFKNSEEQVLVSDQDLHISHYKVYCEDRTLLALFITNHRQQPMQNLTLQFAYPPGLNTSYDGEPTPRVNSQTNTVAVENVPAVSTTTQIISIQCTDFRWLQAPAVRAQVSFAGRADKLNVSVPLIVRDFLRPAPMSTQQYGNFWKDYPSEEKLSISNSSVGTSNEFMSRVANDMGMHPVQTIGLENIVAGKLANSSQDQSQLCFLHGKVKGAGNLEILVRSKAPVYSQAVASYAREAFR